VHCHSVAWQISQRNRWDGELESGAKISLPPLVTAQRQRPHAPPLGIAISRFLAGLPTTAPNVMTSPAEAACDPVAPPRPQPQNGQAAIDEFRAMLDRTQSK